MKYNYLAAVSNTDYHGKSILFAKVLKYNNISVYLDVILEYNSKGEWEIREREKYPFVDSWMFEGEDEAMHNIITQLFEKF